MNKGVSKALWTIGMLLWMGFIFYMSSRSAEISGNMSDTVTDVFQRLFFRSWKNLSPAKQALNRSMLEYLIRKAAHYSEFALLGCFMGGLLSQFPIRYLLRLFIGFAAGAAYAWSDEFHQAFVAGRARQFFDVCIDCAGVLTGLLIVTGIISSFRLDARERKERKERREARKLLKAQERGR